MNLPPRISAAALPVLIAATFAVAQPAGHPAWHVPRDAPLLTRWAQAVDPNKPLPEYPRPQLTRRSWLSLNGLWEFAEAEEGEAPPVGRSLSGTILVPFPVESALSGVMRHADRLWYRRTFVLPRAWRGQRILLHFGSVDWETTALVNGVNVGSHQGGYDAFTFDITDAVTANGPQELIVGVADPTDVGEQPRGKQVRKPEGIWYTSTTGIWQTVWLEPVPTTHIEELIVVPHLQGGTCGVIVKTAVADSGVTAHALILDGGTHVAEGSGNPGAELSLTLPTPKVWSPEHPHLYDLAVELRRGGRVVDSVRSYFGMREIALGKDSRGVAGILLNGAPVFQVGPLDQGFWPDGIYTAPTDEALRSDIEVMKKLGFNAVRKHVKVEPDRWYYWADKLGLLVWQDMPSGDAKTAAGKQEFERELMQLVITHRNHPSIIMWVVFNEGWGQYDAERLTAKVKQLDPTRLVNNASGWTDKNAGDVVDVHNYPAPKAPSPESIRASVLGEFGGLGLGIDGHRWREKFWGYRGMKDAEQLTAKYESFLKQVYELRDSAGLSAAIYTQITDVEVECNGLLTYDRAVVKPTADRIAAVNRGDFRRMPPAPVLREFVPTSEHAGLEWRYTMNDPGPGWEKPSFTDSSWSVGLGGFGTAGTPGAVVRTSWPTGRIWLRRHFAFPSSDAKRFELLMHHDEDAVVYLNGIHAATASGWTTEYEPSAIAPTALHALHPAGNVIAVTCTQTGGGQYIDAGIVEVLSSAARGNAERTETSITPTVPAMRGGWYVNTRAPLAPAGLMKLPIGNITPSGWLYDMLDHERTGMTGRLAEISPWLRTERSAWGSSSGEGDRGWEELPYWLKGFGDLAYVLRDDTLRRQAMHWIDTILASQRPDGWFGPRALLTALHGTPDLWPNMVMLNVLQSFYEQSGDPRVLPFMTKYFRWQNSLAAADFAAGYWPRIRFGDNIESIYWLYNRTGEPFLLDLAGRIHGNMARWDSGVASWHNVNFAQGFREPAVFFVQSGDSMHLRAAERNYRTAMQTYGQFPGGGFAADENARPGYVDPRQGFETCGFVEFMHSFEMLTKITGTPAWADRCEEIAFNSLPAALTSDQRALRYLTCANQVQLDTNSRAPVVENGGPMFSYSPFEVYRCCQHNVSHGWPYYAEELWLATADSGVCASLYAASDVRVRVGSGETVTIREETSYPFDGRITLTVRAKHSVRFPLYLRVPDWCPGSTVSVNGEALNVHASASSYVVLRRTWTDGDRLVFDLPMHVRVKRWELNMNSASVQYGPLWFSLRIDERWEGSGRRAEWPEWQVMPASEWNYALVLDEEDPSASLQVVRRSTDRPPVSSELQRRAGTAVFTATGVPLEIAARGRAVPNWQKDYRNVVGALQPSPVRTAEPEVPLTLIPMGAARLRISSFPVAGTGLGAHDWLPPMRPRPIPYKITASYCNRYEDIEAVADGFEPRTSSDDSIPRMTWWAHKGTHEWVQYDFSPRKLTKASVYWVDDTGEGECRIPKNWRILYRRGSEWAPVEPLSPYRTVKDAWSTVTFAPVETSGMRLEVDLLEDYSGGILEWKIE